MPLVITNDAPQKSANFTPFERADAGTYLAEVIAVEQYDGPKYENRVKTEEVEPNIRFAFKALRGLSATAASEGSENEVKVSPTDSKGEPFQFRLGGIRLIPYGNENANLTKTVDKLAGRGDQKSPAIALSERPHGLDLEGFIGNKYKVAVNRVASTQDPTIFYNNVKSVDVYGQEPPTLERVLLKAKSTTPPAETAKPKQKDALAAVETDPFEN